MPRGGKREGAGKPKGHQSQNTLDKIQAREHLRQMVCAELTPMVSAQIANAKGINYLVIRDKENGKFLRVGEALASSSEEVIEVWEKDPSIAAFTDLLNRALDLPAKPPEDLNVKAKVVFSWKD